MRLNLRNLLALALAASLTLAAGCSATKDGAPGPEHAPILYGATVDPDEIGKIIADLTGVDFQGRLAGSDGNVRAIDYIAKYFQSVGLTSPTGLTDYRQPYKQRVRVDHAAATLQLIDGKGKTTRSFAPGKEFAAEMGWPGLRMKADMKVGAVILRDLTPVTDAARAGKIALIPAALTGSASGADLGRQILTVVRTGSMAGAIIERPLEMYGVAYFPKSQAAMSADPNPKGELIFYASAPTFTAISDAAVKGSQLRLAVDSELREVDAANVIGYMPGTDEKLKNSPILISAHFDAVGPNGDGTYNPGGMDNASGAAAVMAVAKALAAGKTAPARPIIFAAFNGEEEGYCGSKAYIAKPVMPLKSTVLVNIDMVGTEKTIPLTVFIPKDTPVEQSLQSMWYSYAKKVGLAVERGYSPSGHDDVPFAAENVPAITLADKDMDNYHSTGDTATNTDPARIEKVVQLILYYLDQVAFEP